MLGSYAGVRHGVNPLRITHVKKVSFTTHVMTQFSTSFPYSTSGLQLVNK